MNPENDPNYLKVKDAAEAVAFARETLDRANVDFRKKRFQFFDKLILLNGSALAFSATVLSYLQSRQQQPSQLLPLVVMCWVAFFVSILFAILRNYLSPEATWHDAFELYTRKKAEHQLADAEAMRNLKGEILDRYTFAPLDRDVEKQIAESNAGQWSKASKTAKAKAERRGLLTKSFEIVSLAMSCVGLGLLVAFTIVNAGVVQPRLQEKIVAVPSVGCGIKAELRGSSVNSLFNPNSMTLDYMVSNHSGQDYTLPDKFRVLRKSPDSALHADAADLGFPSGRFFPREHTVEFPVVLFLGNLLDHRPTEKEKLGLEKELTNTASYLLFDEGRGCEIELPAHTKLSQ